MAILLAELLKALQQCGQAGRRHLPRQPLLLAQVDAQQFDGQATCTETHTWV
jgi:hypothetical protein